MALVLPPAAAYAASTNYVQNATFYQNDYGATPGYAYRSYNELWRPAGYVFSLFYSAYCCRITGDQNPLLDSRDASNSKAGCQDISAYTGGIYPVTCQTDGA